jgi:hypothetical protein
MKQVINAMHLPNPSIPHPSARRVAKRLVATIASALLASQSGATALGQTDDFNDGNDDGWSRIDLSGAGLSAASYTFPADGHGGQAYRVKASPPPVPDAGPARVMMMREPAYTRFVTAADFLAWDATVDQAVGVLSLVDPVGLGVANGYTMNYNVLQQTLQINEITQEAPTTIAESAIALNPMAKPCRFVFSGYGGNLLGQVFALPDTNNPVASVVATDATHTSGKSGLLIFSRADAVAYTATNSLADGTFDNYQASAPAAGSLRAVAVTLSPYPNAVVGVIPAVIQAAILDRETEVDLASIALSVDGQAIPSSAITLESGVTMPGNSDAFPGVTVTCAQPTTTLPGAHTVRLTFSDTVGGAQTNEWTFTYATLLSANAHPAGSGATPGFNARLVQAPSGTDLANSLARAELQLAPNPPASLVSFTTNALVSVINFSQKNTNDESYTPDGSFGDDQNFPGIDPAVQTDPNDFAMEILTYLELEAGNYTFGVICDDGFQLRSGAAFTDTNATVLGVQASGTYNGTFDFIVESAGLYPFRLVWFERGGGAHVEWFNVDRTTSERTLINAPDCPIKAYATLVTPSLGVESAPNLTPGAFSAESGAQIDSAAKTITITKKGDQRFYRLTSSASVRITSVVAQGDSVVLRYE